MSALEESRVFKYFRRRHVSGRQEGDSSHPEAGLPEGRPEGRLAVGFASCFGCLLLA